MALRHHDARAAHAEEVETGSVSVREPLSPAQIVSFALGVAAGVTGAVGLLRIGDGDMTSTTVTVAGLAMTGVLAIAHVALGVIALLGAGGRGMAISALGFSGAVLIVGGIVALIERVGTLGWTRANGIVYLVAGAIALAGAAMTRRTTVVERRSVTAS